MACRELNARGLEAREEVQKSNRTSLASRQPTSGRDLLLSRFFADAGWIASRYRVGPAEVRDQRDRARDADADRGVAPALWIEDLVLAVACARGDALAWTDLRRYADPVLQQAAAEYLDASDAAALVASFWDCLRAATRSDGGPNARTGSSPSEPSLSMFSGSRPLQAWLLEHLLRRVETADSHVAVHSATVAANLAMAGT